ncbi:MAG TPA: hypothetical protein VGM82_00670 [Gemmatimonadaceae bacterium]|jgi:hypothetical protein
MLRQLTVLVCAIGSSACGAATTTFEPLPPGGHHVLFIGNSLTAVNDLPATLAAIATSAGDTIYVAASAGPNLALIDHANGGSNARAQIARGGWEYVILQQGPTPAGVCRDTLVLAAKMLDRDIRRVGATPALLMSWTDRSNQRWFEDVRISFQAAAAAVDGVFFPAGEAWRSAWRADASLSLYGSDGYHPSSLGTFLTALEIYERVTGKDPRALPLKAFANGLAFELDAATIRALQTAAHDANSQFSAHSTVTTTPTPAAGVAGTC